MNCQLQSPTALRTGNSPQYSVKRRLDGSQSLYGRDEVEKILFLMPGIELGVLVCPSHCLDTVIPKVDCVWNVTAHAQKPDFVFRQNGRVYLNRRGQQFSRLLAAELCASAVVMLDKPSSEVVWSVLATPIHSSFTPSLPQPCVTVCHHVSSGLYTSYLLLLRVLSLHSRLTCKFCYLFSFTRRFLCSCCYTCVFEYCKTCLTCDFVK